MENHHRDIEQRHVLLKVGFIDKKAYYMGKRLACEKDLSTYILTF